MCRYFRLRMLWHEGVRIPDPGFEIQRQPGMELDLQRFAGIHTPVQLSRFHRREQRRRQSLALGERGVSAALRIYLVQRR